MSPSRLARPCGRRANNLFDVCDVVGLSGRTDGLIAPDRLMPDAKTTSAMLTAPLLASTARTRQSGRTWLVAAAAACAVLLPLLFLAKRRAAQTLLNLDASLFSGDELTSSCHVVAELPESPVHINAAAVHEFARKIDIKSAVAGPPQDASAPQDDERTAALLLAWNAINFSYYPDDGVARWFWRDRDGEDHGKDDEVLLRPSTLLWDSV